MNGGKRSPLVCGVMLPPLAECTRPIGHDGAHAYNVPETPQLQPKAKYPREFLQKLYRAAEITRAQYDRLLRENED